MRSSGGGGGPCGACKFLRRKCIAECVFAPYFEGEGGAEVFGEVHRVFGASNVSKLLLLLPLHLRPHAVSSLSFEARSRLRDPVYGCVSLIFNLQHQVTRLQSELSYLQAHLATLEAPQPPHLCLSDLPAVSPATAPYDLSSLLDPTVTLSSSSSSPWAMHPQPSQDLRLRQPPATHHSSSTATQPE